MVAASSQYVTISRQAMACTFAAVFPAACRSAMDAGCAALDEIDRLEEKLSVFRPDSDLARLNRLAQRAPAPADSEVMAVLRLAARIARETFGAFDITSGTLSRAWGFHRGPKRVPSEAVRRAALAASGYRQLRLDAEAGTVRFRRPGLELNLGAIGKGYAIDRAVARMRTAYGTKTVLLHGGQSSLYGAGAPPQEPRGWKVAIGDPYRPGRSIAAVWLRDRALGTSGGAHQSFTQDGKRYGHILDPRTGWPADQVAGATVLARSAAEADALSTAFFVAGLESARSYVRSHPGVAAVIVTKPDAGGRCQIVALGLGAHEIEFLMAQPEPAGAQRQPMPATPPAGISSPPGRGLAPEHELSDPPTTPTAGVPPICLDGTPAGVRGAVRSPETNHA